MKSFLKKITPFFLLSLYHYILAFLGAFFYCFPSKKLKVIGVTGTNGKTTVVKMIFGILREAGYKVALLDSISFKIKDKEEVNMLKMTMPGRFKLQKFLKRAVKAGCQYAILEVTSEGIKQHRHRFIKFDTAVFTNLSPEHIESHGSFEKYKRAKGMLFKATKNIHVVNEDDKNSGYFLKFPAKKKILYGEKDKTLLPNKINLLGEFNNYNALAAIQVGLSQGIDLDICQKAIEKIKIIPGRMEKVVSKPFEVIIDYAFTPNALEKVYKTLKPEQGDQEAGLICVLGSAGGGRDKWKRPVLGEIAAKYCKEVIVTNEDPYEEDPLKIIEQVAIGAKGKAKKIPDRREAIRKAFEMARVNDKVVITGKGCEPWICVKQGKKIPWDDRQVAREEFDKIKELKT